MSAPLIQSCTYSWRRIHSVVPVLLVLCGAAGQLQAQVDPQINPQIWKQKFGVFDEQMSERPPYTGWLAQDADGDGVPNGVEFIAGTNPFRKLPGDPHFFAPAVSASPDSLALAFPTVAGKYYAVESNLALVDAWARGGLGGVTGDGTAKTLTVPRSAGHFFRLAVTDQATQGDQVSDWAKLTLGLSAAAPITAQSSYDHTSLVTALELQNVVTLAVLDHYATQPPDSATPASDPAVIRISRSGFMLLGDITVPIVKSGTALEGTDYATLPASVVFPAGVNSLEVKVTPLHNPNRTAGTTLFLTAAAPGAAGAAGNYSLGSPALAGITLYPPANATGTGLTASYYAGASSTYSSPLNFGGIAATYSYTKATTTTGSAVITFAGSPASPYGVGSQVNLQFTSGNLNVSPYNVAASYMIAAPLASNSFTVGITGTAVPATGTGSLSLGGFSSPLTRLDPTVDFSWGYGTPNGMTALTSGDNYSVTWVAWLAPSTAGNYVFQLDADDKARVMLDTGSGLQQILENGWDSAATGAFKASDVIALSIPPLPANRYQIRVEFVETTGSAKCKFQWKVGSGGFANIPSANIWKDTTVTTPNSTNNVWNATYHANPTFTPPAAAVQSDSSVTNGNNGDWGTGTPSPSIPLNNYCARWTGQVLPQYSQKYYFVTRVDDGVKLWVNNQLLVDRWTTSSVTDTTGAIDLQAGVLYDLKMEFFESTGSTEAHLSWYSDDQAKQIIPMGRLFPTQTGKPAITSPSQATSILGSGSPFSQNVTASNGATVTASGLPPWLTLVNGVLSGTPPAAGIYQFMLTATNQAGSGSEVMTLEVLSTPNQLTRELWTAGVTGPTLAGVPWTAPPSASDTVTTAEDSTTSYAANTGERLRGYFTAPATGNYYFWIAASNAAELWISNNSEPVNKVLRASVTGPAGTPPRTWITQPTQKSQWLALIAGHKYYFEALHNTGASGSGNHLSVAWHLDSTGVAAPVAKDCPPATATLGGILPGHALAPWDNPPTTTIPGSLYVTNLQGVGGVSGITATGGAFLRVNGTSAVLQLNYSGLSSGATSRRLYNRLGTVLLDLDAQDKNYPALKTSDGGYSWNMQPSDLTDLNAAGVYLGIATLNHPTGEIAGTFGMTAGSQTAPAAPAYPSWSDLHATSDAANSRFLSQASFGPSPADMAYVKANGYRSWIEGQFTTPPTRNIGYILENLSNDPQNPYGSPLMFNSWWKNSVTAPDQLRQRAAFALSEVLVVSDTGPLNNNGRTLADYYDNLLDSCFGNFREILKQVTLSSAMGVYLDMRGNTPGNIQTGLHPNENYAREILQLFSAGLYRVWPDGALVLDSSANAVPTYDQSAITGLARVFTGWTWGQPMVGGRLPTNFSPVSNYLDPMVLVPTKHELGSKVLLDNVVLPPATVVTQTDTTTDPTSTYAVQSTDPVLGPGNLVVATITNQYDLNGVKDLEVTLDNIIANAATGPFVCRQLIQRLVTSQPKPEYVYRVVRAFNGERNVDGVATGVRGDMKEVWRAILLDSEARDPAAAADIHFGKQREPLLRITGPARAFPASPFPNSTYRQLGLQSLLITTTPPTTAPTIPPTTFPTLTPHRLANGETVRMANFVDTGGAATKVPTTQTYAVANTTPAYSLVGATGIATVTAPAYQAGDVVALQFTSGTLGTTAPYNTVCNYTVQAATPTSFTVYIGNTTFANTTGSALTPNNFTVSNNATIAPNYTSVGNTVTISSSGLTAGDQLYVKFSSGGLAGAGFDKIYPVASSTGSVFTVILASSPANTSGVSLIPKLTGGYNVTTTGGVSTILLQTSGNHNLEAPDQVQINFLVTNPGTPATSGIYTVTSVTGPNTFTVTAPSVISNGSQGSTGMAVFPLKASQWTRSGTTTVELSTWSIGYTQSNLNQTPLNSTTVFNFFYPDYQYPGELARAGMTTPEFQLTNDSNTMNLTNLITQGSLTNNAANANGYVSFFGSSAVTLDLAPYMTAAQTSNAGIPALVDALSALLAGGNLSSAARTTLINYVANTGNFPYTTPTATQMRDRVRAIVQLIVTSAEYAIQK